MPELINRWSVTASYRLGDDKFDVKQHTITELSELDELIEKGPSWEALDQIVIKYNGQRLTVQETLANNREAQLGGFPGVKVNPAA